MSTMVMNRVCIAGLSLVASEAMATPISATLAGYELVQVGDAGNVGQVSEDPAQNGFGAVATDFWIGKYQVTIGQYAEFLNAVAKSDPYGLYSPSMNSDTRNRGIEQSGDDGSYVYTVVGPNGTNPVGAQSAANRPITYVSWFDSARFANWMSNGRPSSEQINAQNLQPNQVTDDGAYNLGTATSGNAVAKNAINPNTQAAPTFYIPTENEWYKAAYYSPVKDGPGSPGYYLYGTQSDTAPGNGGTNALTAMATKDLANQANYRPDRRYAVTGTTSNIISSGDQNLLTDVGAFTNTYSYYGAFDMSGNAQDWNDLSGAAGSNRGLRGGFYNDTPEKLASSNRISLAVPSSESFGIGFRLASPVPEPAMLGLGSAGVLCACGWAFKRRGRAWTETLKSLRIAR